ncbi:uncharacterized protein N7496_004965 [Penicillium cataractarum]|uniref:Transcription factor domain-containing protein n=1 Tax=Penicillium cataractarum TaxID=2100454 RepID=A0A9W9SF89_9EURO|nr:uncharacterized protein N7496_004965 [Penicillium cataractarum]KAJ5377556.1 hypothetical protein N7496_004965 [Penicillium cataractarum]
MEDTIVPLFFNSYLYLPKDPHIRNGFMEILPSMFSNTQPGSYLHTSTLAVAFFTVAAWTGQAPLLRASERYFTKALPKIRDALRTNEDSEFDDILVSILLLSTYEEFVAIKDWEMPLKAHLRGAIALINEKRAKQIPEAQSSTIYNAVESQIIKTTRGLDSPMVPTPQIWPLSQTASVPPSPRILLSSAASELVNLRHAWEQMMTLPSKEAEAMAILAKANEIDIKLVSWSYWVPQHWMPVAATIIPQSVRNAGLWRNRCDCYADMWVAATWNTFRDCRILLQSIMLSCLRILSSQDPDGRRATAVQHTIRKVADDICATVPFFLGSQVESIRMKSGLVEYPYAETRPVTSTHKQSAPLMGAWHMYAYLRNLQNADLGLPLDQQVWLKEQMERILVIYFQR